MQLWICVVIYNKYARYPKDITMVVHNESRILALKLQLNV